MRVGLSRGTSGLGDGELNKSMNEMKCSDQYIGETGHPVHHRGTQHRSDIKGGTKNIPSVRHFKNCGVQNLKLTVIERVRKQDQDIRKAREKYWILRLKPNINNLVV